MLARSADIDAFLNGILYRLYGRAWAERTPSADGGMMVVDDPAVVDEILKSPDRFRKNYASLSVLGSNRFFADGTDWDHRRKLTQPTYVQAGNSGNRDQIRAVYRTKLSECESPLVSGIQKALLEAAATVFFRAFDCSVEIDRMLAFYARVRPILKWAQYVSWNRSSEMERASLAERAGAALREYAAEVEQSPDLVTLMERFRAGADCIHGFSPHEEFMMNFFGGIETVAATLGWAIVSLGADPRVQQRLYDEVSRQEESHPYLDCFIDETLRYFPAVPFVSRQSTSPTTVNGIRIDAGRLVLISIVGVHHHRDYWKEPHIFHTARSEFLENTYDRRAFIPFITGPRTCGGARLARLEITEGLKAFIQKYSVHRRSDEMIFDYGIALRPNCWNTVEIRRREAA